MEKPEVIIEDGRENDELHSLTYEFFNAVNEYNEEHEDKAHVVVLVCDSKGGASFMIGNTDMQVEEFLASSSRHEGFNNLLIGILKTLQKIAYWNVVSKG